MAQLVRAGTARSGSTGLGTGSTAWSGSTALGPVVPLAVLGRQLEPFVASGIVSGDGSTADR